MDCPACAFCGNPNATQMADQYICDDCYIARGSCCAEWFETSTPPVPDSEPSA
ncbi:MAG TPA: hypothetical protein VD994_13920 [Prosthecobacter sp.]|nr:hypothetical protein [Prosthecobacter sp.]